MLYTMALPALMIQRAPGNGTQYNIYAIKDHFGGIQWSWCAGTTVIASGWAAEHKGGEVRFNRTPRISRADKDAIKVIMREVQHYLPMVKVTPPGPGEAK